ncbi:WD repeat-containing protein 26 homolog [Phragmites australis]|uniref:WD repeat-containing protein 26 homolog n=1 Tax=Phragmites australis TaxID=29695 RepID=UPI002D77CAAA|nr:WD repeat-containing protein 26 homolog [Phragmites australis]
MKTLQSEITPIGVNRKGVHELSSCIISCSPQQVFLGFSTLGIDSSGSRQNLLEELQKVLPPTVMVPERRFCVRTMMKVWFLQFSNNGKYLASASNDKSAIIWEVDEDGELLLNHTLSGHEK